jgi:FkbM family methyltransferase
MTYQFEKLRKAIALSTPHYVRKMMPPKITRHLYFSGKFKARLNGKVLFTMVANSGKYENEIYWHGIEGGLEKRSQQIWAEYCKVFQPKNILDVGANSGLYSLIAIAQAPNSTVTSIEPIPEAIRRMAENMSVNSFQHNIFGGALSNYTGEGNIYLESDKNYASSVTLNTFSDLAISGVHDLNKEFNELTVPVSTLSNLIQEEFCKIPDLVKIDVETHELQVIEGFGYDLALSKAFLIEVLNDEIARGLNIFFANKGFIYFNINDEKNSLRLTDSIQKSDFWNYFICAPEVAKKLSSLS